MKGNTIDMGGNDRLKIIDTIGREYLTSNIENGEFSYCQVLDIPATGHFKIDIRFYDEKTNVAILVETKTSKIQKKDVQQLFDYVRHERTLSEKTKIVAILALTKSSDIKVWKIDGGIEEELKDKKIKSFKEYADYFKPQNINDKSKVLENTAQLNNLLHDNGIKEHLRSQFVGTCLLALKKGLIYKGLSTPQILAGIKEKLGLWLESSVDKATKVAQLDNKVLQCAEVKAIEAENFERVLLFIEKRILPYINASTSEGHDILSYFFTTFNKYVNREDKNQAFTPNHIAHFMCKVAGITRSTKVLDPTCGSGTFLVQAMALELSKCETDSEREHVKKKQIFGIEKDENVYGLATTNMLIHMDGNSNIRCCSCFDPDTVSDLQDVGKADKEGGIGVVLMNPPYNASKSQVTKTYVNDVDWDSSKTDPSKGFGFVKHIADTIGHGKLLTLLPMQCAIGTKDPILKIKKAILASHTLDAVFSFPIEMFYPGASAVACCMVFDLGKPHEDSDKETFFGYFREDGFEKRKGVGRVDIKDKWESIEKEWLDLYEHRSTKVGLSVTKKVVAKDEWCAEAYMDTDYSTLTINDFVIKARDYAAFLIQNEQVNSEFLHYYIYDTLLPHIKQESAQTNLGFDVSNWRDFRFGDLITDIYKGTAYNAIELTACSKHDNGILYITRTDVNNGSKGYVVNEDFQDIEQGNALIIGDTTATIYYQRENFICGDHIVVMRAEWLNPYTGIFITTVLSKERFRYSYGRSWKKDIINDTIIKLPVDKKGNPDWKFMEDFIKRLPYSANIIK